MGENEQGGMLRTITVIGLVAIIASAVIGNTVMVRNKGTAQGQAMTNNVATVANEGVSLDQAPEMPKYPISVDDSVATANAKLKQILAISTSNEQEGVDPSGFYKHPQYNADYTNGLASKTGWSMYVGDANNDRGRIEGSTIINESSWPNGPRNIYSPMIQVPAAATSMTITYSGSDLAPNIDIMQYDTTHGTSVPDGYITTAGIGIDGGSSSGTIKIVNGHYADYYGNQMGNQFVLVFRGQDTSRGNGVYFKATLSNVQVTFS